MIRITTLLFTAITLLSCNRTTVKEQSDIDRRVDSVLVLMTLQEKAGQMNQYSGFVDITGDMPKEGADAKRYEQLKTGLVGSMLNVRGADEVRKVQKLVVENSRLGIPMIIGYDAIHGYETMSPIPLAESASWDLEAIKNSASVCASETAAAGVNWTFAPNVDITRDARWGRVMEGAGEDPFLGSKIAYARVKGFQGEDLTDVNTIAACAKHFAAYGFIEAGRDYNAVDISLSTLNNIALPPFQAAVDADVKTIMNSFTTLNGVPATADKFLQRDILKGKWNFEGFVISDYRSIFEIETHGIAKDLEEAAQMAVIAGSDMDMESHAYVDHLADLVEQGKVDEKLVDDAVRRILKVKFELGLFEDPYRYCDTVREKLIIGSKENNDAVLEMAKKSIVLLKNENKLLPLKKEGLKIALIGPLSADKDSPLGSWRGAAPSNSAISVLEGLEKYPNKISHSKGVKLVEGEATFIREFKINTTDRTGFKEAINTAKNNDVVIMVLGEHGFQSGEGRSRTKLGLPGLQQELLEEVYKVNKNIVLVLMNGRPLTITWADEHIPAIVESWQLGTQSGNAIAQVLYGDYNPSGKLPVTFPRSVGQVPIYYNHLNTSKPVERASKMVFWSHYSDESNFPLYEFGYGLSYTTFKYNNLKLSKTTISKNEEIEVSVEVSNTGEVDGEEVVQLYIRDLIGSISRPVKELKGFEKILLKSGETKTVVFKINSDLLKFYTANNKWELEAGDFDVWVGGSSDAELKSAFTVTE